MGLGKLLVGWNLMLGKLLSFMLIGTKGKWGEVSSWGGIFGDLRDLVTPGESSITGTILESVGKGFLGLFNWIAEIFDRLCCSFCFILAFSSAM